MNTFGSFMLLLLILVEAALPTASSVPTLGTGLGYTTGNPANANSHIITIINLDYIVLLVPVSCPWPFE